MQRTRQLAAIMFTDIQGYTALMQEDENNAIKIRDTHRSIFDPITTKHAGKIIQYYGDGTLSIFQSAVQAVECAIEMQSGFQNAGIPVRIGLHLGDIVVSDTDIIGDGVNLASRVESLAVAGSVLVSEKIHSELKSHPSIKTKSMGEFHFKNDEHPRQIFAIDHPTLVVPDGAKLKGKTQSQSDRPSRSWVGFLIASILVFSVIAYYIYQASKEEPITFKNARIAILPFINFTEDSDLDVLGEMAADWIISGLSDFDEVKLVNFYNIKDNLDNIALASVNPGLQNQILKERTGAQIIISGSYSMIDDKITVTPRWENLVENDVNGIKDVVGNRDSLSKIILELRERIITLFELEEVDQQLAKSPPQFSAYKKFQEGNKHFGIDYDKSRALYAEAIKLDESFVDPYLWTAVSYANQMNLHKKDSIIDLVVDKFPNISNDKKQWLDFHRVDKLEVKHSIMQDIFQRDPTYLLANYNAGLYAGYLNYSEQAVEVFENIKPKNVILKYSSDYWWFIAYAENLIRTNDLKRAQQLLDSVPSSFPAANSYKLYLLTQQEKDDDIEKLIEEARDDSIQWTSLINLYISTVSWYTLNQNESKREKWSQKLLTEIENNDSRDLITNFYKARAYYLMGNYERALGYYTSLRSDIDDKEFIASRIGLCRAKMNQPELAENWVNELKIINSNTALYAVGQIYAVLDEKDKAVDFLEMAFEKGCFFVLGRYDTDFELVNLKGYKRFEDFVDPTN